MCFLMMEVREGGLYKPATDCTWTTGASGTIIISESCYPLITDNILEPAGNESS